MNSHHIKDHRRWDTDGGGATLIRCRWKWKKKSNLEKLKGLTHKGRAWKRWNMSPLFTISRRDETYRGSRCESVPCKLSRTWGSECFCVDPLICFGNQTLPLKLLLAPKSFSLLSCQLQLQLRLSLGARMLTAWVQGCQERRRAVRLHLWLAVRAVKCIRFNSGSRFGFAVSTSPLYIQIPDRFHSNNSPTGLCTLDAPYKLIIIIM